MSLDFAFLRFFFPLPPVLVAKSENLISSFNHLAENLLLEIAILFKIVIESIALLILALAIVRAVKRLLWHSHKIEREEKLSQVRLDLGKALALSLEFLLAADIVATAVSPSWSAVGKLAAISAIRTFLNFFLEREVRLLAKEKTSKSPKIKKLDY
ncbi:DUF1622 domain-containing protein [Pleurocapsa sp. FMAR1]|uniref:DUF1622 domain-containing protein n=1 Tax=Pleurocapsa sp. FMAR1 TaxID=3040204 RepID=UPI0029C7E19F|nr:DUF1622 domain-containing protein [Pleurocapsa sp. FMAR1]